MTNAIGVDLGGTKTNFLLVDEFGKIKRKIKYPTPKKRDEIIKTLVKGIKKAKGKEEITGIGFGLAGFLDCERGLMRFSPNIPAIKNLNFKKRIGMHFKEKLVFENDANAFALAEYSAGYNRKYKNIVGVTLGTGIGTGIVTGGMLVKGKGYASEMGHMVIDCFSSHKCGCGNFGCFEALADGKALMRSALKNGLNVKSNLEIAFMAENRKPEAIKAIDEIAEFLAIGFVNIANIFDPDAIVIGGGLANIDLLIEKAGEKMKKYKIAGKKPEILKAKLGDDAPAIGAALLAQEDFLRMKKTPLVAVDAIIEHGKGIVLVERKFEPKGWALPGGLVEYKETLEKAVKREAFEETGLKLEKLRQFKAFSGPGRDPRGHAVSIVFKAKAKGQLKAGSDAKNVKVFELKKLPKKICFDHEKIIREWLKV